MRLQVKNFVFTLLCLALLVPATDGFAQFGRKKEKRKKEAAATEMEAFARDKSSRDAEASETYFVDGMKYFLLEDYGKALERFQQAYALSPGNAAINYKLAEIYLLTNKTREAIPFAQAALSLDKKNTYYYLLLAQLYGTNNQYTEAAKVYLALVNEIPGTEQYLVPLADIYIAQNRFDDALKTYDRIEKAYGPAEEISFKKQQIYLKQNNLDKALQEGEKLIAANPEEIRYHLAQAEMLMNNNRQAQAQQVIKKALGMAPDNAFAHLMLADIHRQKGNVAEAEQELKLAFSGSGLDIDTKVKILIDLIRQLPNPAVQNLLLELADATVARHPKEAKAFAVAGDIQTLGGKKAEARANYLKAIALDDSHFKIWQQIILLDAELNETDSLVTHSEKALELFPNQAVFWFYNGTAYLLKKDYAKAVRALEQGKKLNTDNKELLIQFNIQLGDSYHALKEYEKSDAAYEAVLAHDSNNAHVLNNYSYFLSTRSHNLSKAEALASRLIKQFPDNATYLDTYAWVLYKQKKYENARKYLELALNSTTDATIMEHYGDVLYQLGKTEEAVQQWIKAKNAGEASELIDKKIKDRKLYE